METAFNNSWCSLQFQSAKVSFYLGPVWHNGIHIEFDMISAAKYVMAKDKSKLTEVRRCKIGECSPYVG